MRACSCPKLFLADFVHSGGFIIEEKNLLLIGLILAKYVYYLENHGFRNALGN